MNDEALKLIFSSDNESTVSTQSMVSLVEDTKLGVRKILPKDTLNKTRVILEDKPTIPPDVQQTKTQTEESEEQSKTLEKRSTLAFKVIRKNKLRTKRPNNPYLYSKWVPVTEETKPSPILQQKQMTSKLMNNKKKETLEPG